MSGVSVSVRLSRLIKKTTHHDKDERFMAVSDVTHELEQPDCPQLDAPLQLSLSRCLLQLLDDASTDVQTISVKCLGVLVKKIGADSVREVVERLSTLILDPAKDDSRDVYVIGMKTIIAHTSAGAPAAAGPAAGDLGSRCLTLMISGLKAAAASSGPSSDDIVLAAMEICHQLLLHFASSLSPSSFEALLDQLLQRISSSSPAVQKKSVATLGALTPLISDRLFHTVMQTLTAGLTGTAADGGGGIYVYLQGISTVSATAGSRISKYLPDIVVQLERFCAVKGDDAAADDGVDELKQQQHDRHEGDAHEQDAEREREVRMEVYDNVLSAFEALLLRCSNEITPYVGSIVTICRRMCRYDPNYAGEDAQQHDDDAAMNDFGAERKRGGSGGGWDDDDDGTEAFMDDDNENDDNSWKVRRAALRCLQAFIVSKPDLFSSYFSAVFDTLLGRLRERDVNVQLAVLDCISTAVKECVVSSREAADSTPSPARSLASPGSSHIHALLLTAGLPVPIHTRPSLSVLSNKLPALFASTLALHSHQPFDSRRATLDVWKSVVGVMEGGCDAFLPSLLPALTSDASDSDTRLRTDALLLLRLVVELHPHGLIAPYLLDVCTVCVAGMSAGYLKLKAEALRLASSLLVAGKGERVLVEALYNAVYAQLLLTDVDAEVKEAALSTMSLLLSLHHALLPPAAVETTLPIFHSRLTNEVTRLSALRAITRLTSSPSLPLAPILASTLHDLLLFLRKDNAILRQETMLTLLALVRTQGGGGRGAGKDAWSGVAREVEQYIDDRDVYVSTLAMDVMREVLRWDCAWLESDDVLMQRLMALLQSPLLQGTVLTSLTALFSALVACSASSSSSPFSYTALIARLSRVNDKMSTTTLMSTAQCIGAVASQASPTDRQHTIATVLSSIPSPAASASAAASPSPAAVSALQLSLYVLGGVGRQHDLSQASGDAFALIQSCLSHPADAVRQAAAFSLGSVTAGNPSLFLPLLLSAIPADRDKQFLTLTALLTLIQTAASSSAPASSASSAPAPLSGSHVDSITPLMFRYSESEDEGVRAIVSECLGGLALLDAKRVVPQLVERVGSDESKAREVVIAALRHAVPSSASSSSFSVFPTSPAPAPSSSAAAASAAPSASTLHVLDLLTFLSTALPSFFALLSDRSLPVQRQALLTFTSLAHSHPSLLQPHVDAILPLVYPALHPLPSHIRVVDLGPFKHRVDDGLPLRTAAFTLLSTVFTSPSLHLSEDAARTYLRTALKGGMAGDCGDGVAAVVWEDLERLCSTGRWTRVLLAEVDGLVADMMKSIREQMKAAKDSAVPATGTAAGGADGAAGGQGGGGNDTASRARDVLRVCVRALLGLSRLRGIEGCAAFQEFYARVLKTQLLVTIMAETHAQ